MAAGVGEGVAVGAGVAVGVGVLVGSVFWALVLWTLCVTKGVVSEGWAVACFFFVLQEVSEMIVTRMQRIEMAFLIVYSSTKVCANQCTTFLILPEHRHIPKAGVCMIRTQYQTTIN